jgi:DNA-binding transcriptional regulator YhcF (GntR family)
MVKLTGEQVAEIRRAYVPRLPGRHVRPGEGPSMRQLAEKYGVSQQTISDIVNGKNWCAT